MPTPAAPKPPAAPRPPALLSIPKLGAKRSRPPRIARPAIFPTGPEIYRLTQEPGRTDTFFDDPPIGFVTAHTSKEEWWLYKAFAKVLRTHDPYQPPYAGDPAGSWSYQKAVDGGRVAGGSVVDFVVTTPAGNIGIRLQTERWHLAANSATQAKDLFLKTHVKALLKVVDIYSIDFLGDPTGKTLCAIAAEAAKGNERLNPLRAGTFRRVRV